ncbi:MAG: hypothetical protein Q8W51_01495 [Candidatus Palauibacterales bacterium]|nr:hypothetical protein [Candidatus Palauibacterales bacterium]MDP2528394.1 hypothetical protein [Candidatus Palauibacterales bacterium]MDP2584980.1 hypothetical protein [Candidatus Palauibacterales bacterium]
MTREQLEHAIRAACDVAKDTDLIIFGSQAILGEHPEAPAELRASVEVDVQPRNRPEGADAIDANLGELSLFHRTHGFYVHGVSIEAATLPRGWEDRTVPVSHPRFTRGHTGHCLESHDLAASKLFAFREKDRDFVRVLLVEGLVDPDLLEERIRLLPIDDEAEERLLRWLRITAGEL